MSFKSQLEAMKACKEAIDWVDEMTLEEARSKCERIDWMLWLVARVDVRLVVECAAKFARTVLHLNADARVLAAIKIAEQYVRAESISIDAAFLAARAAREACQQKGRKAVLLLLLLLLVLLLLLAVLLVLLVLLLLVGVVLVLVLLLLLDVAPEDVDVP